MDMNVVTPEEIGFSSTRLNRIGPAIQGHIDQGHLPGAITLVARHGKVAHFECYGMMDIEADKSMQPDTIFRIYSMTKPITSVALMMLYEEGRFTLDDPVSRFIPEFSDLKVFVRPTETGVELSDLDREITVLDLFTHTAGLGYGAPILSHQDSPVEAMYRKEGIWDQRLLILRISLREMIQKLVGLPLVNQPGSDWHYSAAHDVIGYLVGVLSGMPFDSFLEERIFKPLGMDDTGFYVPREKLDRFAALYERTEAGGFRLVDAPSTSPYAAPDYHPSGGVGLVSTASDYLRFAQMLLNGGELNGNRLLTGETLDMMARTHLPDELSPIHFGPDPWPGMGYGLGFGVHRNTAKAGVPVSDGTFGWIGWGGTGFWIDPRKGLIRLWLTQFRLGTEPVDSVFQDLVYQALAD